MANKDKKDPSTSIVGSQGPVIVGEKRRKYWVGRKDKDKEAAVLELALTPMDAVNAFGGFAQREQMKGKGLPVDFCFMWVFTSCGFEGVDERIDQLEKRVEELEKKLLD